MAELSLFLSAFLAATILPFSSEAAFVLALSSDMPHSDAMISASLGNILAIVLNYILGFYLFNRTQSKLQKSKFGLQALKLGGKYGYFTLIFSWLPLIGDPLTLVAGVLRLQFVYFILIAGFLRVLRYYILTLMV